MSFFKLVHFAYLVVSFFYTSSVDAGCTLMRCSDPKIAPKPWGPYCTAVRVNDTLHLSGIIAFDEKTDKMVEGGIKHETEVCFGVIKNILQYYNATYENIAVVRVYLIDFEDLKPFNDLYQWYIRHPYPARTLVKVSELPESARLQLEVTAVISDKGRFEDDPLGDPLETDEDD